MSHLKTLVSKLPFVCALIFIMSCSSGIPSGDQNQSTSGSWFRDSFEAPQPYPGYANYNPTTTLASTVGHKECQIPVNVLTGNIYPSKVLVSSNGEVWVATGCGIYVSKDQGRTFKQINVPDAVFDQALFVQGSSVYIGTLSGLYVSRDGGSNFSHLLSVEKATGIIMSNPPAYRCVGVGPGSNLITRSLYVSGSTLLVGTNLGMFVSNDGGTTFTVPVSSSDGFLLPPIRVNSFAYKDGKIYAANSGGNGAFFSSNTAPVTGGACAFRQTISNYGLLVSSDGGNTFSSISSAGHTATTVWADSTNIYFVGRHINTNNSEINGLSISRNNGLTFDDTVFETRQLTGTSVHPFANNENTLYSAQYALSTGGQNSSKMLKSEDGGRTFTTLKVFSAVPDSHLIVTSTAHGNGLLYAMTDHGLFISRDNGATFPVHKRLASSHCAYPWWRKAQAAAAHLENLYFDINGRLARSNDSGRTFSLSTNTSLNFSQANELWAAGNNVYAFWYPAGPGIYQSTDGGNNFGSILSSVTDPVSNTRLIPLSPSNGGYYLSTDQSDQRAQLTTVGSGYTIGSAVSIGNRIVASLVNSGFVVYENGNPVYSNRNLLGNSTAQGIRIRYLNGVIYALGIRVWASYDGGTTFSAVPGSPTFPIDAYATTEGSFFFNSQGLYKSSDNGRSLQGIRSQLGD